MYRYWLHTTHLHPILQVFKTRDKGKRIQWNEEAQRALEAINALEPVALKHTTEETEFIMYTDASTQGLGVILEQVHIGIIGVSSRSLHGAERNYPATHLELLAIKFGFEKFRYFLQGAHTVVVTITNL